MADARVPDVGHARRRFALRRQAAGLFVRRDRAAQSAPSRRHQAARQDRSRAPDARGAARLRSVPARRQPRRRGAALSRRAARHRQDGRRAHDAGRSGARDPAAQCRRLRALPRAHRRLSRRSSTSDRALAQRARARRHAAARDTRARRRTDRQDQIADDPTKSPCYVLRSRSCRRASRRRTAARLQAEARKEIRASRLRPLRAVARLSSSKTYVPHARESIGMSALPDGAAWYAYSARLRPRPSRTPEQIHEIGLAEVEAHPRARWRRDARDRLQGHVPDVLQLPAHRPALLLHRQGRRCSRALPRHREAHRSGAAAAVRPPAAPAVRRRARARRTSRRSQTTAYYHPRLARRRAARASFYVNTYELDGAPEVGDGGAHAARGGARPSPADRARAGAQRPARVPHARRLHRVRRGLGRCTPSRSATRSASTRIRTRSSASSPTRCGARCGSSSTPASTRRAGRAQQAIDYFRANTAKTDARHRERGRPLHRVAGPGARVQDRRAQDPRAARRCREARSARASTCARSTTSCSAHGALPLDVLEARVNEWVRAQSH